MFAFGGGLVVQTLLQHRFGNLTAFEINRGWQDEIAIWNIAMILVLIPIARDESRSRAVLPPIAFASLLFFSNHLWGVLSSRGGLPLGNLAGAVGNALAVLPTLLFLAHDLTRRAARHART